MHPLLQKQGFYALLGARLDATSDLWRELKLLHIGYALNSTLRVELLRPDADVDGALAAVDEGCEVVVMLAEIVESSLKRKTTEFMNDITTCLRQRNLPAWVPASDDGAVRTDTRVTNAGDYSPLKARSRCEASA